MQNIKICLSAASETLAQVISSVTATHLSHATDFAFREGFGPTLCCGVT